MLHRKDSSNLFFMKVNSGDNGPTECVSLKIACNYLFAENYFIYITHEKAYELNFMQICVYFLTDHLQKY